MARPTHITRLKAASIHLLLSCMAATFAAALVFLVWYRSPLAALAGGTNLFLLIVGVDVVLGPALTAVIANPRKAKAELARDLTVIVAIQMTAFGYGLYTMALARPVLIAFEVDRLRVITASDVDPQMLNDAPTELRRFSWTGPRQIAAVKPTDSGERINSIELGLAGVDLAMQPKQWREYSAHAGDVWRAARPVAALLAKYPQVASDVAAIATSAGQPPQALRFLPLTSRQASWVSLIAEPGATVVGHLPVDGFF